MSIEQTVKAKYGTVATSGLSSEHAGVKAVAEAFGYTADELASIPAEANMGLSCGNPTAYAKLKPGETVVDLGCGGGLDVFLAAAKVGPTGKAIGVDMTPEMLSLARSNAAKANVQNVEFHQSTIDKLPLADGSVDCVISNCVINLATDKLAVFREIARVLKPGGRVAISDIALKQPLPAAVVADVQAYVGCIAGAIQICDYERMLREAGFAAVVVIDTGADLNIYAQAGSGGCCSSTPNSCCTATESNKTSSPLHDGLERVLAQFDANAYAATVRVHALKPSADTPLISNEKEKAMKTIQVFDKPMCCSTGVCGPQVDPVLPRFAADLEWLKSQGHHVERFNLAQQPAEFIQNPEVHQLLATQGTDCLPLILIDGHIVSRRDYPPREMLSLWLGTGTSTAGLPVVDASGGCCGGSTCS